MGASTGIALAVGGITLANEVIFAPAAGAAVKVNWRVIPATLGLAAALNGLEKLSPPFAAGLGWIAMLAVLIVPFGNAPTPLNNLSKAMGY